MLFRFRYHSGGTQLYDPHDSSLRTLKIPEISLADFETLFTKKLETPYSLQKYNTIQGYLATISCRMMVFYLSGCLEWREISKHFLCTLLPLLSGITQIANTVENSVVDVAIILY